MIRYNIFKLCNGNQIIFYPKLIEESALPLYTNLQYVVPIDYVIFANDMQFFVFLYIFVFD